MNTTWFLDLRAHAHGGPVGTLKITDGNGGLYTTADLSAAIQGRDVLLMAHGYNVNRPHGTASLNHFKSGLVEPAPLFIGVLWPGDCVLPIFIDYVWEGGEANKSGDLLGEFVSKNFGNAASVSFASHSLGARVMLRALAALQDPLRLHQFILLAAAIEDDSLTQEFADAADKVDHITAAHSLQDHVLQLAYPPGNLLGSVVDHDHPNVKAALGRLGPLVPRSNIWSTQQMPNAWDFGHTDFLSNDALSGAFPLPIDVSYSDGPAKFPPETPADLEDKAWKPCWAPAFVSTRWHRG